MDLPRFSFLDILILCNFIIKREKIRLVGAGIYVDGIRVKMEDGGKIDRLEFFSRKRNLCVLLRTKPRNLIFMCMGRMKIYFIVENSFI